MKVTITIDSPTEAQRVAMKPDNVIALEWSDLFAERDKLKENLKYSDDRWALYVDMDRRFGLDTTRETNKKLLALVLELVEAYEGATSAVYSGMGKDYLYPEVIAKDELRNRARDILKLTHSKESGTQ